MDSPIRILIVDASPARRAGLEAVLTCAEELEPVGSAAGAGTALRMAPGLRPDVVLIDVGLDGALALSRALRTLPRSPRVVFRAPSASPKLAVPIVVAGGDGLIDSAAPGDELAEALRSVHHGVRVLPAGSPELARHGDPADRERERHAMQMAIEASHRANDGRLYSLRRLERGFSDAA